jgi:ankyrin repeat protein
MFENVKFLVEKGADVKIPSAKTNVLPIEYALFFNAPVEVSELLIKNGGGTPSCFTKQILKKRVGSDSLVMYWIRQRNIVKAALLAKCYRDAELEIWDDLNYENMTGDTAVKLALKLPEDNWSKKLLEVLLQNGANVNHIDRYGLTPMYFAIQLGKLQFLEELFDYGANPNIVMESLGTALQYAKRLGNPEIIKFMEEKFALPKYLKGSKYPPTRTTRKQSKKIH